MDANTGDIIETAKVPSVEYIPGQTWGSYYNRGEWAQNRSYYALHRKVIMWRTQETGDGLD